MNNVKQVDNLITDLKNRILSAIITASAACWELCLACLAWAYVYSSWGAECTPSERRKRFKMCPDKISIKAKCKAFDNGNCNGCQWFPEGERTRCFDCRGFVHWILLILLGFDLEGDIVSTQWNSKKNWIVKGQIGVDPIPQNVLVNIFIKNKTTGKWTHTGFYYNGSTCECSNGVQYHEKMQSNRWTHWAIAKCFANGYQIPAEPNKEPAKQPAADKGDQPMSTKKTIRKGNYGVLVKECQTMLQKLGYDLGICGIDGDFGQATEKAVKAFQKAAGLAQDGVVGQKTWTALEQAVNALEAAPKVTYYTVTIPHQTESEADAVIAKYPNAKKVKEG